MRARAHPLFALTREVRRDADHALHQHELTAVMHLVLFGAEHILESRLGILAHRIVNVSARNSGESEPSHAANFSPSDLSSSTISAFVIGFDSSA